MDNASGILALWFPIGSHDGKHSDKQRGARRGSLSFPPSFPSGCAYCPETSAPLVLLAATCVCQLPVSIAFPPKGIDLDPQRKPLQLPASVLSLCTVPAEALNNTVCL